MLARRPQIPRGVGRIIYDDPTRAALMFSGIDSIQVPGVQYMHVLLMVNGLHDAALIAAPYKILLVFTD